MSPPAILVGTHWAQPGQKHSANAQGATRIHSFISHLLPKQLGDAGPCLPSWCPQMDGSQTSKRSLWNIPEEFFKNLGLKHK